MKQTVTKTFYFLVLGILLVLSSCTSKKQKEKNTDIATSLEIDSLYSNTSLLHDTINDVHLGDCFVLKGSDFSHGFLVYEIQDFCWKMLFVQLNQEKIGIESFSKGRFWAFGDTKFKQPNSVDILSEDSKIQFLEAFKKVGNVPLNKKRPKVVKQHLMQRYTLEQLQVYEEDQADLVRIKRNGTSLKVLELIKTTTTVCKTFDCLEKNKKGKIEGLLQKYTPNTDGKNANQMLWEYELLLADGTAIPIAVEESKLEIHKYENKKVMVSAVMFFGIIKGFGNKTIKVPIQQASGYRLDVFDIEQKK